MSLHTLQELVIILAVAVVIIYISHKIKLPPVVGFLLTGILIGPGGFSLVKDTRTIDSLAEIGVVMLLFSIGLEFTLDRMKRIQKIFWIGGGLQVVLTTSAAVLVLVLLRVPVKDAVFYGFLVSLSSTAVVLKILSDRGEIDAPQGRISFGILIFQDLAIVPMIALVPILANVRAASPLAILSRFLLSAMAIAAVFAVARFLMPKVLHLVVGTRIREIFLIASLFACLGMALLTASLGLSLALGAFLAGVIISESDYSNQVVSDILPFRDVFNSLFFISIGMLLHTGDLWNSKGIVAGLVLSIFLLKAVVVFLAVRILGYDSRISLLTGLALAQVGEFSFVLAGVGRLNGLLPENIFQVFLASSILTILATPFFIQISPRLASRKEKPDGLDSKTREKGGEADRKLQDHVIIAGYGLNGRNLAHVLKEAGVGYIILELNPETVRTAAKRGDPHIFGDASSRTILKKAGIQRARTIVFAISDPATTRRGVRAAREMGGDVFIVVRTRYASEIDELYRLGANDVIPEEFETSVEIFTRVLQRFHIPRNIIDAQVKIIRGECYGVLRGTCEAVKPSAERLSALLSAGTAESYYVSKGSWPAGKTLGAVDLRNRTGATVIAVVRGEESFTSPGAEFAVEAGDTLVLVASHRDMNSAFQFLAAGHSEGLAGGGSGRETG
ncbi:MAG: cation:proton antiporter [Candidatus Aminicenantes bacterium]|nr:cation:proton antiporter [Candidatus Aminicenantes bacterium]